MPGDAEVEVKPSSAAPHVDFLAVLANHQIGRECLAESRLEEEKFCSVPLAVFGPRAGSTGSVSTMLELRRRSAWPFQT